MAPSTNGVRGFADRFELKSQAGTGGMGTVYQAIDRQTGAVVAIKILHGKSGTDAGRFLQEAALLAEIDHPGIVRYVDHGVTSHGEPYIAMEWLGGETLEQRLVRGPLSAVHVAGLARRVLEAMAGAHERSVVHRDIKPSNIFLVGWRLSDTRILDFGIARRVLDPKRFTKAGSTVGTPMYAAPEQARGAPDIDHRADIFSLGCVLYECLTGEPPFTGDTPMAVMAKICLGVPPRLSDKKPNVPAGLERLIDSMLAQDRRRRADNAATLAAEFAALVQELGGEGNDAAETTPAVTPMTISDADQRVMCALIVSFKRARTTDIPAAGSLSDLRLPAKRAMSWNSETMVLTVPPLSSGRTAEIEQAIEPFGGQLDRLMDQNLLITLPGQATVREQALQAARCALALRQAAPDAAMAIGLGRAAVLAKRPVGPLVERSAKLVEGLQPGAIRIEEAAARLLPARFTIHETKEALHLVTETEADDRPRAIRGRLGSFVGRDREVSTLAAMYEECAGESVARAALILAGPGQGKTRLRQEFLRALDALATNDGNNATVFLAAGSLVRAQSHHPLLARLLAQAGIDEIAAAPALRDAWIAWLRAKVHAGPVVLVLEDLQWADIGSIQLVDAALRALHDQPLFVLGLGRPEVDDHFPSLWSERAVERLRLPPLSRRAGQTLLRQWIPSPSPEMEAFVLDRWEGNAFFLEELVRAALSPGPSKILTVPEIVHGMIEARFEPLPIEVRRLMRAASLFGDDGFTAEGVLALMGEKARRDLPEWLDILVARDLAQRLSGEGEGAYRFRHKLIRESAYRMLPPGDKALCRRLARVYLETNGKTLPDLLTLPLSQPAVAAAGGM